MAKMIVVRESIKLKTLPTHINTKIVRNSLGQFKRKLERLIYTSVWYTSKVIKDNAGVEHTIQSRHVNKKPYRVTVPQPLTA